ncbi:MAG: hypothetical protein AB7P33_18985 [Dehalococcoidia bacterium]
MIGASSEGRSAHSPQNAGGQTSHLLSRAAIAAAATTVVVALLLVYRLWVLSMSRLPEGFPGGWLLSLSDLVVEPFRNYDHSAAVTKQTGYVDFPTLVALEVCLVAILVFAVFAYLFHLLQPHQQAALVPLQPKQSRQPSRMGPALRAGAVQGRQGVSAVVASIQGQDWAGHRANLTARRDEAVVRLAAAWRAYVAGCSRDAAWLRERWQQACASAAPALSSSDQRLNAGLRRTRRSLRRTRVAAVRLSMRSSASMARATTKTATGLSNFGAGARSSLERGSGWYWSNFDTTSNRVAAAASKLVRRDEATPPDASDLAPGAADGPQLSRREFFRRIRPLR